MAIVGIRDLNRDTKGVIERLEETREPVILTRQGQPIATILPLDKRRLNDLVLSTAPDFVDSVRRAEEQFERGETRPLHEAMDEIRATHAGGAAQSSEQGSKAIPEDTGDAWSTALQASVAAALGAAAGGVLQAAMADRARRLSEDIVEEAVEEGMVADEGAEPTDAEPLAAIVATNERLFGLALAAEGFRAIGTTADHDAEADQGIGDLEQRASDHVRKFNLHLLYQRKAKGGISVRDYARYLEEASPVKGANEPTPAYSPGKVTM